MLFCGHMGKQQFLMAQGRPEKPSLLQEPVIESGAMPQTGAIFAAGHARDHGKVDLFRLHPAFPFRRHRDAVLSLFQLVQIRKLAGPHHALADAHRRTHPLPVLQCHAEKSKSVRLSAHRQIAKHCTGLPVFRPLSQCPGKGFPSPPDIGIGKAGQPGACLLAAFFFIHSWSPSSQLNSRLQ